MTVLADFEVILGHEKDNPGKAEIVVVGDSTGATNPFTGEFNSGGRLAKHTDTGRQLQAFITLNVRGINTTGQAADVEINGKLVGKVFYALEPIQNWRTQMIPFDASILNDGDNRIVIRPVPSSNPSPGNLFDDYNLMSVVCFFRQDSD